MTTTISKPFYKKTSRQIFWVLVLTFLIAGCAYLLLFMQQEKNTFITKQQLPQMAQTQLHRTTLLNAVTQIDQLKTTSDATLLPSLHQALEANLTKLKYSPYKKAILSKTHFYQTGNVEVNLNRLAKNNETNIAIKQKSEQQLKQLIDNLQKETLDKEIKLEQLYSQIDNDRANDRVTANRARAHAKLMRNLNSFHQLDRLTAEILTELTQLNIQTSQANFEILSKKLEQTFTIFSQLNNASLINNEKLAAQFSMFEQLLFTKQLGLSKWRGHLRIAQPYFIALTQQKQQLLARLSEQQNEQYSLLEQPNKTLELLTQYSKINISEKQFLSAIYITLILLTLLLFWVLFSIRSRVKKFNQENLTLCHQLINAPENALEKTPKNYVYSEQEEMAEQIGKLQKPLHSEADYKALFNRFIQQASAIQEQTKSAYFSSAWQKEDKQLGLVQTLIGKKIPTNTLHSLLSLFGANNKPILLAAFRSAKASQQWQNIRLADNSGGVEKTFAIAINYQDGHFVGTINDCSDSGQLALSTESLTEQLAEQKAEYLIHNIEQAKDIEKMATRLLLQNQNVILAEGISSLKVHHRLSKLFDYCEQEIAAMKLKDHQQPLTLNDVNLRSQLQTTCFNLTLAASRQKNEITLTIDEKLAQVVNIDIYHFNAMLMTTTDLMLAKLFNAELHLNCQLVDQNHGQQIIKFTFTIALINQDDHRGDNTDDNSDDNKTLYLPLELANLVANDATDKLKPLHGSAEYIELLYKALYVKAMQSQQIANGYQFSFELPLAITEKNADLHQIDNQAIDLKQAKVLILSPGGKLQLTLKKALSQANAKVENLERTELIAQQISISHLEKNPVDLIILSPQYFTTSIDTIQKHINNLPPTLRPKLFVMQPNYNKKMRHHGIYLPSQVQLFPQHFIEQAALLLQNDIKTNLLIEQNELANHCFDSSPTNALVAVENIQQQQTLIKLLHCLGLQITIVNNKQSLIDKWQTGRFSILISTLTVMPFITLAAGSSTQRCIIQLGKQPLEKLADDQMAPFKHWQLAQVKPDLFAKELLFELAKILAPWLNKVADKNIAQGTRQENREVISEKGQSGKTKIQEVEHTDEKANHNALSLEEDLALFTDELAELLSMDSESIEKDAKPFDSNAAFDLNHFAINQGSPILAAYMLEDYLEEINENINLLENSIDSNNKNLANEQLSQLSSIAHIIAAATLAESCQALIVEINSPTMKKAPKLLEKIKVQRDAITLYAEEI